MQINNKLNINKIFMPNFKENLANSAAQIEQKESVDTKQSSAIAKAYASPQIKEAKYKLVETTNIPHIGDANIYKLANNHTVILVEKEGLTTITTGVSVGSEDDSDGKSGTAHLLEHLLASEPFYKTKKTLKLNTFDNACTGPSETSFFIKAPIENNDELEKLINFQHTVLTNNDFSNEEIEKEKKIICQEHATEFDSIGRKNDADIKNAIVKNLFGFESNFQPEEDASTNSITKEDLDLFYKQYYQPKNMVTVMVGDFKKNDAIELINKYFGQDKNTNIEIQQKNIEKKPANLKEIELINNNKDVDVDGDATFLFLAFPPLTEKEQIISGIMDDIIPHKNIDLYNKDDDKNIFFVSCNNNKKIKKQNANYQEIFFFGDVPDYNEKLKNLFEILKTDPISKKDLEKIKQEMYGRQLRINENSNNLSNKLASLYLENGNINYEKNYAENVKSITVQDIKDFANKYFDSDKVLTVKIKPQKAEDSKEVSFGSNIKDNVKEYELPNNLKVVVDTRKGIATTTIRFDINAPLAPTPQKPAISKVLDSLREYNMFEYNNIINLDTNDRFMTIQTNDAPENTLDAINQIFDSLLNCDLSELTYEIENRDKEEKPANDDKSTDNSEKIENEKIETHIQNTLNKGNPYNYSYDGIEDVSQTDVLKFHSDLLSNASGVVFITMPKEDFEAQKDDIFKKLSAFPKLKKYDFNQIFNSVKDEPLEKNEVFCIKDKDDDTVEISQTFKLCTTGKIEDRIALTILDNIIGENETSRLFEELREQEKLCYSAYSNFEIGELSSKSGTYKLSTYTSAKNPENIEKILKKYQEILDDVCTKTISEEELESLKNKIKKDAKFSSENSVSRNDQVAIEYNTLYGLDYDDAFEAAIDKLTAEDIKEIANKYFKQHHMIIVSGNKEAIEKNEEFLNSLKG